MSAYIDLTGHKYGKLTVESLAFWKKNESHWRCRCDCGESVVRRGAYLRHRGSSQSCGCTSYVPIRCALVYEGELRTIQELSQMTEVSTSVLYKAAKRGELSAEWLKAYAHRQYLLRTAKKLGITSDLLYFRRQKHGDVDEIYTTPKRDVDNYPRLVLFRGEQMTIRRVSELTGLAPRTLLARVHNGVDLEAPKCTKRQAGAMRHGKEAAGE